MFIIKWVLVIAKEEVWLSHTAISFCLISLPAFTTQFSATVTIQQIQRTHPPTVQFTALKLLLDSCYLCFVVWGLLMVFFSEKMFLGLSRQLNTAWSQDLCLIHFLFKSTRSQFIPVLSPEASDGSLLSLIAKIPSVCWNVSLLCSYQHFVFQIYFKR